ncbi:MAG: alpha/beta hydrolase [Bacteroidia bacterium]
MNTLHSIKIQKTARYACIGTPGPSVKHVWIVLHGYGHLANYFIKKFEALAAEDTLILAPEGLHRFYLNGVDGRVGASWMTKEDRLSDIADYISYLDTLYETIITQLKPATVSCIGFSQGGATLSRWVAKTANRIDTVVMWASVFPPDMNGTGDMERMKSKKIFFVVGNEDEYITASQKKEYLLQMSELGISYKLFEFEGRHEIHTPTLLKIKSAIHSPEKLS